MDGSVILVEGESDKVALEEAALLLTFDLCATSIVVMNGAANIGKVLTRMDRRGTRVAVLYYIGEQAHIVRALSGVDFIDGRGSTALERLGFFACDRDLEAELIRALGADRVIAVIEKQGDDLRRFRSLQQMPEWRGRRVEDQLQRWFGSGSRRKIRYAALLVREMAAAEVPRPIRRVLQHALGH